MRIDRLDVLIKFEDKVQQVGQLVLNKSEILFKYEESYLSVGDNLSPLKLTFDDRIQGAKQNPFDGLFGVFADSLPDAWGRLLMRNNLLKSGKQISTLNSLDQLNLSGDNGLGALIYRPSMSSHKEDSTVDLDILNNSISTILAGESTQVLDDLFQVGGSPGGARPKVYTGYSSELDSLLFGTPKLPDGFDHWIIKFGALVDQPDIANIEYAYYLMVLDAGIEISESRLFESVSGKKYFGTKRFDRVGNDRIHMVSAAGMFHDDYERSQMDYGTLLYESNRLMNDVRVLEQVYRRAIFNVYAHNRDDHSKNFAFLMNSFGKWALSPAYDLTFSSSSQGHHSTTCAGNGIDPGEKELLELADDFSIKNARSIIAEIKLVIADWQSYANKAMVSKQSSRAIENTLKSLLKH